MNDNDEIAVTMWRALEKADPPEAGGIVLAKLVATWLGGYRPLDRAARWSEFQHTMRREMAARDRRFFGERVDVPGRFGTLFPMSLGSVLPWAAALLCRAFSRVFRSQRGAA